MRRLVIVVVPFALVALACGSNEKKAPETKAPAAEAAAEPETTLTATAAVDTLVRQEPAVQRTPAVVEVAEGNFTVQVSSWRTRRKAESQMRLWRQKGYDAYVQRAVLENGETWYRVRIGSFATLQEARQFAAPLAELLESGYWVDRLRREP